MGSSPTSSPRIISRGHIVSVFHCCSTVERGDRESSGLAELYDQQVSHLSPRHLTFFTKWYGVIAKEEQVSKAREGLPLWLSGHKDR